MVNLGELRLKSESIFSLVAICYILPIISFYNYLRLLLVRDNIMRKPVTIKNYSWGISVLVLNFSVNLKFTNTMIIIIYYLLWSNNIYMFVAQSSLLNLTILHFASFNHTKFYHSFNFIHPITCQSAVMLFCVVSQYLLTKG